MINGWLIVQASLVSDDRQSLLLVLLIADVIV
jgi:hypothetical protein